MYSFLWILSQYLDVQLYLAYQENRARRFHARGKLAPRMSLSILAFLFGGVVGFALADTDERVPGPCSLPLPVVFLCCSLRSNRSDIKVKLGP